MASPTTLIMSLKIILISAGAISIAMAIKLCIPSIIAFTCYDIPIVWNSMLMWLRPPYLYFIINGIIIIIAASSRFNHYQANHSAANQLDEPLISVETPPPSDVVPVTVVLTEREAEPNLNVVEAPLTLPPPAPLVEVYEAEVVELKPVVVNGIQIETVENDHADDWMVPRSDFTPPQRITSPHTQLDLLLPVREKPLVSSRFGHRKPIQTNPQARLARPQMHDNTLESTWKMITEGRHVPLTRHLKKSDTWGNHGRDVILHSLDHDLLPQHVPKSETFRDGTNYEVPTLPPANLSPIPGKIKKEPSLSQDELNSRVEAFIKKVNEEMRLQRQESLNQYMEMIKRGAY